MVVRGCQKLVLILLKARRTKANNTSAMGGVHLIITPTSKWSVHVCSVTFDPVQLFIPDLNVPFYSLMVTCGMNLTYMIRHKTKYI